MQSQKKIDKRSKTPKVNQDTERKNSKEDHYAIDDWTLKLLDKMNN